MLSTHYTPRNLLVTGGAGFIGANFIRYFLDRELDVNIINLDLLTYAGSLSNLDNLPHASRYKFIQGDIGDAALIDKILREHQIDTIIHFAAESHVDRSIEGPAPFIQTNVVGTFVLLEAARLYWLVEKNWDSAQCRFHHVSTDEVYGSLTLSDPAFTETTAYAPNSPYSASKASSDHLVRSYFHTYRLPITMSHCSNNYGPYQHAEKFIPTIIRSCLQWQPIPVYGNGSNIRDWLYVEDHCHGISEIVTRAAVGETYNLGGETELDNLSVVDMICQLMDDMSPQKKPHNTLINFVMDRPGHDWRYAVDISKISADLGWKPKQNFVSGIYKTITYQLRESIILPDGYIQS
jgi:dTDP-glucose 4,6-dehydratase